MENFKQKVSELRAETEYYEKNKKILMDLAKEYQEGTVRYETIVTSQRLLTTLSDKHFNDVLKFISGIINKALLAMYPDDQYRFDIARSLYNGKSVHLNATIEEFIHATNSFELLDIKRNIGNGQAQVISYLFTLCMYKVSNSRPIILIDEILTGFTEIALEYIIQITKVFANEGFQFISVEYSFENFGTPILVKKRHGSTVIETSNWEEVADYFNKVMSNGGTQLELD